MKDLIVEIVGLIVDIIGVVVGLIFGLKSLKKKCESKEKDILKDYCEI